MSIADLLPTRLYWAGLRGVARMNGHEVRLTAPPVLPGVELLGIDYVPGELAIVLPAREGWREMTPAEVAAAREALEHIVNERSAT